MLEFESAWKKATSEWTCPLLMVNRLVAQHVFMRRVDRHRRQCGPALGFPLPRRVPHRRRQCAAETREQEGEQAAEGSRCCPRSVPGAAARREASERRAGVDRGAYQSQFIFGRRHSLLGKAGGVLKVPRKTHAKKDAAQAEAFKPTLSGKVAQASAGAEGPVRIWLLGDHCYGLLPVIRGCRGARDARARALRQPLSMGLPP